MTQIESVNKHPHIESVEKRKMYAAVVGFVIFGIVALACAIILAMIVHGNGFFPSTMYVFDSRMLFTGVFICSSILTLISGVYVASKLELVIMDKEDEKIEAVVKSLEEFVSDNTSREGLVALIKAARKNPQLKDSLVNVFDLSKQQLKVLLEKLDK